MASAGVSGEYERVKPYYRDDSVVIYHADCLDLLPMLKSKPIDLVLTDPPYGINIVSRDGTIGGTKAAPIGKYMVVTGDNKPFDPGFLLELDVPSILWGGNHYADRLPASPSWLVWDKRGSGASSNFADCELAWTNIGGPARLYRYLWRGMIKGSFDRGDKRLHPTQKPVLLMRWCLEQVPDAKIILDPYMGSGSTLRAAKDLGRKAIGIEIEEKYAEIAAKRMEQTTLGLYE